MKNFDLEQYLKTLDEMPACNMLPSNLGRMVFLKALELVEEELLPSFLGVEYAEAEIKGVITKLKGGGNEHQARGL
jgi:hypothetical protein